MSSFFPTLKCVLVCLAVAFFVLAGNVYAQTTCANHTPGDQPSDRDALVALYCATGGASWSNKTSWLSSAALISWHGVEAAGNTVTNIVLSQNNLTGTIPSELGNLSNLKRLDFRVNNLTGTIPSELGDLGSLLLELSLNRNQLTGTIPSELGKVPLL